VASRLDEVDAGVNPVVNDVHTVDLVLSLEIGIESLLNVLNNWSPGVIVVHKVAESGGVDHSQSKSDAILFDVGTDRLDGDSLWDDVQTGAFALARRVERGIEESVDESRLPKTRFT
jgi:hypothetical protein